MRRSLAIVLIALATTTLSCAGPHGPVTPGAGTAPGAAPALRVGTNGASPPYAFDQGGRLTGLEIDLAQQLGTALRRPVEFTDVRWNGLFEALLDGRVDVVMAGVTVTPDREVRVAFGTPYLVTSIAALIRSGDARRFRDRDAVCRSLNTYVGVVPGTMGEKELRRHCPTMLVQLYPTVADATRELLQNRIDAVVGDAPVMTWQQSMDGSELAVVPTRIGDQRLAWAFRPGDAELRARADSALAAMRADGTLDRLVARWIPSRGRLGSP